MSDAPLTGPDLIDEMVEEVNLDQFYDRDPKTLTDEDFHSLIEAQRAKRAVFITAKE